MKNIKILHKNHFINVVVIDWALFCSSYLETWKTEFHVSVNSIPTLKVSDWRFLCICPPTLRSGIPCGNQLSGLISKPIYWTSWQLKLKVWKSCFYLCSIFLFDMKHSWTHLSLRRRWASGERSEISSDLQIPKHICSMNNFMYVFIIFLIPGFRRYVGCSWI